MGKKINLIILLLLVLALGGAYYATQLKLNMSNLRVSTPPSFDNTAGRISLKSNQKAVLSASSSIAKVGDVVRLEINAEANEQVKEGAHLVVNYNPKILQPLEILPNQMSLKQLKGIPTDSNLVIDRTFDSSKGILFADFTARDKNRPIGPSFYTAVDFKIINKSAINSTKINFDRALSKIYVENSSQNIEFTDLDIIIQ